MRETLKLGGEMVWCPISLPEINVWQHQSKIMQKQNESFLVLSNFA